MTDPEVSENEALFLAALERELLSLPLISRVNEYLHFHEQLREMRKRSKKFIRVRFAMEMAVLLRLREYEFGNGLPLCQMPPSGGHRRPVQDAEKRG